MGGGPAVTGIILKENILYHISCDIHLISYYVSVYYITYYRLDYSRDRNAPDKRRARLINLVVRTCTLGNMYPYILRTGEFCVLYVGLEQASERFTQRYSQKAPKGMYAPRARVRIFDKWRREGGLEWLLAKSCRDPMWLRFKVHLQPDWRPLDLQPPLDVGVSRTKVESALRGWLFIKGGVQSEGGAVEGGSII